MNKFRNKLNIAYLAFIEVDISSAALIHCKEITENFVKLGHSVSVFLPKPLAPQSWKGVDHYWIKYWGFDRLRQYAFFLESALRIILRNSMRRYNVLYIREMQSNPFISLLSKLIKLPIVIEVNGWLIDDLRLSGASKSKVKTAIQFQRSQFNFASGIIVSTKGNANNIVNYYGISKSKVKVQDLGVNLKRLYPGNKIKTRRILNLPIKNKIIIFAGIFHPHHDINTLILAFRYLMNSDKKCTLAL